MAKELAPPSLGASAPFARVGSWMLPGALPRSGENSDIFVLIPNTPSTLFGRDSAVLRNGTAMNGDNVFPTTRIAVAPSANGRRTISSDAAVGSGLFHFKEAMSALVSFTPALFSVYRK